MRIGIVTFWDTEDNYGQVLQIFALIRYLDARGHVAYLLKTKRSLSEKRTFIHKFHTFVSLLKSPRKMLGLFNRKSAKETSDQFVVDRSFELFKETYVPSSQKVYSYEDLCNTPIDADIVWFVINPVILLTFPLELDWLC